MYSLAEANPLVIGGVVLLLIVILVVLTFIWRYLGLYIRAWISGAHIGMLELIGMGLRRVNPVLIVNSRIQASRAGINVPSQEMESHVLAGGDVTLVINAMIAANKAN
ncbi:MAG: flotillin-like FloA family protein, partial [Tepidisphaeraceae bacterium]